MNRAYVFVVCGDSEHVETLHAALKTFQRNTKYPILVVTDVRRNKIPVNHDNVIHVDTPEKLNHHQAAIFLKTSLHKYLPIDGRYVYMDSDILAIGGHCDEIFDEYLPPIRFAADHCLLPYFSPTAINCNCKQEHQQLIAKIQNHINQLDFYGQINDEQIQIQRKLLKQRIEYTFSQKFLLLKMMIKSFFSWPIFHFDDDFKYNKRDNLWYNSLGQPIMYRINWSKIASQFDLKFDYLRMKIKDKKGKPIWACRCNHLHKEIENKFHVKVKKEDWQHWNGGVFIFDKQSHDFLNFWHETTMEIFNDENWKTRDQGTLVATAWKFGLEKHPILDEKWNFICDFNNSNLKFREEDKSITKDLKIYTQVEFAHVYHHFGDESWDFWNLIYKEFQPHLYPHSPPMLQDKKFP